METSRSVVTATFEIAGKLVPHLEERLHEVTHSTPCTLSGIEVTTAEIPVLTEVVHVEQILQPGLGSVETDGGRGGLEQGDGLSSEPVDARENGELAGASGEGEPEPLGGNSDGGSDSSVPAQASGDVAQEPSVQAEAADSGLREETSGDSVIVATKES